MVQHQDYHYTEIPLEVIFHTTYMLTIIPFAFVLGLYTHQDKTVLCYIHKLQSQIPYADILGLCKIQDKILRKLQYKILLCYTHYIMHGCPIKISFSVLASPIQHVSAKLLELHHDDAEKTVR